LSLKVDLLDLHSNETIDAESVLASNIKDEAEHTADVATVGDGEVTENVTEETIENEFMTVSDNDEIDEAASVAIAAEDDFETDTTEGEDK